MASKKRKSEEKIEKEKESVEIRKSSDLKQAAETAKKRLADALQKTPNAATSISKEGNDWVATIEMVEEEYLPGKNLRSMNDIIGIYEVKLSSKGDLISWNKKSSHKRGN